MQFIRRSALALAAVAVFSLASCTHRTISVPAAPVSSASDRSYTDLNAGQRLRVVVPVSGLVGYQQSFYSIESAGNQTVRLVFQSAQTTLNGKAADETHEPKLPFALPRKAAHLRLIYLVRVSQSDHNMAIAASKNIEALNAFTTTMQTDSAVCGHARHVFCTWVPQGVAVRPE